MTPRWALLLVVFALFSACGKKESIYYPAPKSKKAPENALFVAMEGEATGLEFFNHIEEDQRTNILNNPDLYDGGGVGVLDYDGDGRPDLFFIGTQGACRLFHNRGDIQFEDVTESAGIDVGAGLKTGVTVADVNADGYPDIYVCRQSAGPGEPPQRNLLFVHNGRTAGQGRTPTWFTERARDFGLADTGPSTHATFFDGDADGDLDALVLNGKTPHRYYRNEGLQPNSPWGKGVTFTEATAEAGLADAPAALTAVPADVDGDGLPDLVFGARTSEHALWINNRARPGRFAPPAAAPWRRFSRHTTGIDVADVDHDGRNDVLAVSRLPRSPLRRKTLLAGLDTTHPLLVTQNVLALNNGDGTFRELAALAGIHATDYSWAPLIADFDNDGQRDIFISNGLRRDITALEYRGRLDSITGNVDRLAAFLDELPVTPLQNFCFRNRGDGTFEDVSTAWGFVNLSFSGGAAYADLDSDGDLDLVVNNLDSRPTVYRNRASERKPGGHWLQLELVGGSTNPSALGARVRVCAGGTTHYAELMPTRGFLSSVQPLLHVGLGDAARIERIEVEFPAAPDDAPAAKGKSPRVARPRLFVLDDVAADQRLKIVFANARPGKWSSAPPCDLPGDTTEAIAAYAWKLVELPAPPFVYRAGAPPAGEPASLRPLELTATVPPIAVADVNDDGLDDFYAGNGPGAAGGVFLQRPNGTFRLTAPATWQADRTHPDHAAAFFDADGDGDADLLVAGSDTAAPPRLYRNLGNGNFVRALVGQLPALAASPGVICPVDHDGDGDLDLFVGGGAPTAAMPLGPPGVLLRNDDTAFTDVTLRDAPAFAGLGGPLRELVWTDLDGDSRGELLLAGLWGPPVVFSRDSTGNARWRVDSRQAGLEKIPAGLWRSLLVADVDADGDNDIVAGNLGWNSPYSASAKAPLRLFVGDLDANGTSDRVLTVSHEGHDLPVGSLDELLGQFPALPKKYRNYAAYAKATVRDLFTAKTLDRTPPLAAEQLASCVLINENGRFTAYPLPAAAQSMPVTGMAVVRPATRNRRADLVLVGPTGSSGAPTGVWLSGTKTGWKTVAQQRDEFVLSPHTTAVRALRGAGGKTLLLAAAPGEQLRVFVVETREKERLSK